MSQNLGVPWRWSRSYSWCLPAHFRGGAERVARNEYLPKTVVRDFFPSLYETRYGGHDFIYLVWGSRMRLLSRINLHIRNQMKVFMVSLVNWDPTFLLLS